MDKDAKIKELEYKNAILEAELHSTKEHLKKYTAPSYKKAYYEKNKKQILDKMKSNPTCQDKRKEYNHQAYLRRKEKLKHDENEKKVGTENI
jgi:hypothetical protein